MYKVRNILYLLFILAVLGSVVFLLAFREKRQHLIAGIADRWTQVAENSNRAWGKDEDIFKLPPPPPKAVDAKVLQVLPNVVFQSDPEQGGVLYRDLNPPASDKEPDQDEKRKKQEAAPLKKTDASATVYKLLTEKSEVARKLTTNGYPEYRFTDWSPVQERPPVFFIQITAKRVPDGQDAQFIWSVNSETGEVRPLSQMARDLESRNR